MFQITSFLGILLFTTVCGQECMFQRVNELNGLIPKSTASYLYYAPAGPVSDCFQFCSLHQDCYAVINTGQSCYASIYPTDETYTTRIPYYDYHNTYFKRSIGVCEKDGYFFYKDLCVKLSSSFKTWYNAKVDCESTGGQLISLDTEEKYNSALGLLTNMSTLLGATTKYYIGTHDLQYEGTWDWLGNPKSSYFQFYGSQPNNADVTYPGQPANCGILRTTFKIGIHDEYCLQEYNYMCEAD